MGLVTLFWCHGLLHQPCDSLADKRKWLPLSMGSAPQPSVGVTAELGPLPILTRQVGDRAVGDVLAQTPHSDESPLPCGG